MLKPADPGPQPPERPIGELVHELIEQGKDYARAEVGLEDGAEVVAYCHSGSRSAIATQVLRALGFEARNYVGSWHEWSRHDDLPIA